MFKLIILLLFLPLSIGISAQIEPQFAPGELIVQIQEPSLFGRLFSNQNPIEDITKKYGGNAKSVYLKSAPSQVQALSLSTLSTHKLTFPNTEDLDKIASELQLNSSVKLVQKNQLFTLFETPNDPGYSNQSYVPLLNIDDAWDTTQGDTGILVAVIDSGVAYNHPDLSAQMWINPFISGDTDADGNEQNNDIRGWDFGSSDTGDNDPLDNSGHGTNVSGLISAQTNNGIGIAGVGYNLTILPIKVTDSSGGIGTISLTNAIYYAIEKDVDIINMSLGGSLGDEENTLLANAVESAIDAGIIVVAAAGNVSIGGSGYDIDEARIVPATLPDVIAVSATDLTGEFASDVSLYGDSVDFSAPGKNIYTTSYTVSSGTHSYDTNTGTSFSAPIVSGVIGLLLSHENNATLSQIYEALQNSATDSGSSGHDQLYGHGLVNAADALEQLRSGPQISLSDDLSTYFSTQTDFDISITDSQGVATESIRVSINYDSETVSLEATSGGVTFEDGILTLSLVLFSDIPESTSITIEVYAEDLDGESSYVSKTFEQENSFLLFGHSGAGSSIVNAPNPFSPRLETTSFTFEITQSALIDIKIYSLNLEPVRHVYSGTLNAGYHDTITWDGRDESNDVVPNGVYIFVLSAEADGKRIVKRNRIAVLAR
jgi:subtilisin family serine protease